MNRDLAGYNWMRVARTLESWWRPSLRAIAAMRRRVRPSLRRSKAGGQGFALMEVLVASALMGLVLVALLQLLSGALRAQEAALEHARALQVAELILQETCNSMNLDEGHYQGERGPYQYLIRVTPQYVLANNVLDRRIKCSLIQVTVSWPSRGGKRFVALETVRSVSQRG